MMAGGEELQNLAHELQREAPEDDESVEEMRRAAQALEQNAKKTAG